MSGYLIQYVYPGTVNGEPVGTVYVTGPHFVEQLGHPGCFSHTYRVSEAAVWPTRDEAERELTRRSWGWNAPARVVPLSEARDLK